MVEQVIARVVMLLKTPVVVAAQVVQDNLRPIVRLQLDTVVLVL
jgi:hypothetical protein